jgi:hypothetical protein
MKNKKSFPIFALMAIAGFSIAACSPSAAQDQSAPPPVDEVMEEPTVQVAENPFNPIALGTCYNPFNPVMEGKVWKYTIVSGDTTSTMDISYKDVTTSSFTSVQQFPDISTEVQWTCGPDGLLSSQFANMSIAQVPDLKFETVEVNGVLVPTEDKWQVGYSWNTEYVIKVSFTSGETAFEGQGNMAVTNTISAVESVTVPSGTYSDAYKVDISGNMVMNIMGTESTLPLTYSTWYVKNVGMVKSASVDPTLAYTVELASLE